MRFAFAFALILIPSVIVHAAEPQQSIPQNVQELWANYEALDKSTPLEVEVLKEWEQDAIVCRIVRYQVGIFKGSPSRVAAFYAFPKGATNLPALVQLHGGGQSASLNSVVTYAKRGYASVSLNWGGNAMNLGSENWSGPQTDGENSMRPIHPSATSRITLLDRSLPMNTRSTPWNLLVTAIGILCSSRLVARSHSSNSNRR